MRLNAPTMPIFFISLLLAVAVVAVKYFGADIPVAGAVLRGGLFEILLIAYGLLFLGNVFRRF